MDGQVKRGRGRPAVHESAAARQAAYRQRQGRSLTVYLDDELLAALDAYLARQVDAVAPLTTRSQVIEKLLRTQLLRKR